VLITTAENLKALVTKYRAVSSEKAQLQVLRQRSSELVSFRTRINNQRVANDLLKRRRMRTEALPPLADNVMNIVSKLNGLASMLGALGGSQATPHFNSLNRSGAMSIQQMEAALIATWQAFVDDQTGKYDVGVLADWEHVPDFRVVARNIRAVQGKLNDLRSRIPTGDDDFTQVQTLSQQLKEAWKEIENTPSKILKFLREASTPAGVPLVRLDVEILDWIRQRKLEASFKIRTATDNLNAR
jgi:hypothetical protein